MPVPRRQRAWLSTDSGAYVASVVEDGPAAKAGIQEGDAITKLDDDEITSADGLIIALRSHEVGEKVEITLMRGKDESIRAADSRRLRYVRYGSLVALAVALTLLA